MIWRIYCPWRNEIACEWGHVACWLTGELCTGFWWGKQRESFHLGDPNLDGRMFLRWIFRKWDVGACPGLRLLRLGRGGGHF